MTHWIIFTTLQKGHNLWFEKHHFLERGNILESCNLVKFGILSVGQGHSSSFPSLFKVKTLFFLMKIHIYFNA